jgi:hypothetical protein
MLRAADAAIDIEAMRVTLWNAAWRSTPAATPPTPWPRGQVAGLRAGQRTVHATQHLHGGMGADITYPIHRYFLWGKQIELLLGGPSAQLARLGARHRRRPSHRPEGRRRRERAAVCDHRPLGPFFDVAVGDELPSWCSPSPAPSSWPAPSPAATTRTSTTIRCWPSSGAPRTSS